MDKSSPISNNVELATIKYMSPANNENKKWFKTIDVFDNNSLSYDDFFNKYLLSNIPCMVKNITVGWEGLKWIINNKPNFEFLIEKYGDVSVPVANCDVRYFNAQMKETQTLRQYLKYWQSYISNCHPKDSPCLYLKDWHFTKEFPNDNLYRVPKLFSSDWLNEYFASSSSNIEDDYRFVYMGPKGSWTPLHADVFSSYSWSVNLCGKKRWIIFPPGEELCFTDKLGNLVYDVESPLLQDHNQFENYVNLKTSFEVIQQAGEAIFIPSGWHHQVWNLDDTISINHNWINGCNVDKMWLSMRDNLATVKSEISDCADMDGWLEHCQTVLNAVFGLDYPDFCKFLLYIINIRIIHLTKCKPLLVYGDWLLCKQHLVFDLTKAKDVILQIVEDDDFIKLSCFNELKLEISNVLEDISCIIKDNSNIVILEQYN